MANTYKKIATVTVGSGGTTSIQFTNIPNTYTDLVVMASLRHLETGGSAWATIKFTLNGATGSNSQRNLYGLGFLFQVIQKVLTQHSIYEITIALDIPLLIHLQI